MLIIVVNRQAMRDAINSKMKSKYNVESTASDASYQIGMVERPHHHAGEVVFCKLLRKAELLTSPILALCPDLLAPSLKHYVS